MKFSEELKQAKDKLGLNRADFARLLGRPIDSVTKYYQGTATPNQEKQDEMLAIIKKALE